MIVDLEASDPEWASDLRQRTAERAQASLERQHRQLAHARSVADASGTLDEFVANPSAWVERHPEAWLFDVQDGVVLDAIWSRRDADPGRFRVRRRRWIPAGPRTVPPPPAEAEGAGPPSAVPGAVLPALRTCPICGVTLDADGNHWNVGPLPAAGPWRVAKSIQHFAAGDPNVNLLSGKTPVTRRMVDDWLRHDPAVAQILAAEGVRLPADGTETAPGVAADLS